MKGSGFVPGALAALTATLVLGACSATPSATPSAPSPSARTVDLTMTDQRTFEPARIEVRRGETVRFRVRNVSNEGHEAYIGTEEEQRAHETIHTGLGASQQGTTTHFGYGIHVAPFGSGDLVAKFDQAYAYVIGCHYPGHYAAGMRAVIVVTQ